MPPTRVVHIQDVDARDGHVYIGRGPGDALGNPILLHRACLVCDAAHHDVEATLACYRYVLSVRLRDPVFQNLIRRLAGRVLACHCAPGACHGDVLAQVADALAAQAETGMTYPVATGLLPLTDPVRPGRTVAVVASEAS